MPHISAKVDDTIKQAITLRRTRDGGRKVLSESDVVRELLGLALSGGGIPAQRAPFVPPALDLSAEDLGHARREVREEGIMTATPGEALLKFYDEVMAMTGHAPTASPALPAPVAQVVPFRGAVSR